MSLRLPVSPRGPQTWNPLTLALLVSVWIGLIANWPLLLAVTRLPEAVSKGAFAFAALFAVIAIAMHAVVLSAFAWRPIVKPVLTLFLLAAAFGAHFMGTYGVVIDPTMMVNVFQTDVRETRDLLSLRMFVTVALMAGLPIAWLWRRRVAQPGWLRQTGIVALGLLGTLAVLVALFFAFSADLSSTMRNHKSLRYMLNPLNSFWAVGATAYDRTRTPRGPPQPIGVDAVLAPRPANAHVPLFVFVVGETARADHFSLNGYARPTNPELAKRDVVSFTQVTSCGTSTAASLPCMFSHLGRVAFDARAHDDENLLDVFQRAGLAVLWIDNQSGCKGLCDRVQAVQASTLAAGAAPMPAQLCHQGECLDDALLHGLDARLGALDPARRAKGVVLVLHQMGSHGPAYSARSPVERKPFVPECTTNVLQDCDQTQLVNAFDNSIAYTDLVLANTIDWLKSKRGQYATSLLYVSDHGESLGENHIYLHGMPWGFAPEAQKHVPMVMWLSPEAQAERGVTLQCLNAKREVPASHDNLFHTALGLVGVDAAEYRAALDLTASCRE